LFGKSFFVFFGSHRVWGKIEDRETLDLIKQIYELPATNKGGMTFLDENIKFTMAIE
jgi:hypothetical protein